MKSFIRLFVPKRVTIIDLVCDELEHAERELRIAIHHREFYQAQEQMLVKRVARLQSELDSHRAQRPSDNH